MMTAPYYSDDLVALYLGDCREVREWLAADVLVTDPPYGIGRKVYNTQTLAIPGEGRVNRASDYDIDPERAALRDETLALWAPRPALVFGHWRVPRPRGTRMRLIWDRMTLQGANGGVIPWRPVDEEIYLVGDWPNPRNGPRGEARRSILSHRAYGSGAASIAKDRPAHPTPKPVPLMAELVEHCPPGVLADPFAGSGATLLAARQLGRRVIGVEVEERYCELIAERLSEAVLPFGDTA